MRIKIPWDVILAMILVFMGGVSIGIVIVTFTETHNKPQPMMPHAND